jgi:hypothetical protein
MAGATTAGNLESVTLGGDLDFSNVAIDGGIIRDE